MLIYRYRPDRVFDCIVEVPDGTKAIPKYHTFTKPPETPEGYYAIMMGGWKLMQGEIPSYPPPPTPEQIQQTITEATQKRLDDFAKTRNYDNILSACTYATSSVPKFQAEGQYCVDMRDQTWSKLYEILNEVINGTRQMPTGFGDIEAELPILVWPV